MLKKFTLRNYKNFKNEISIDFENIAGYQFNMEDGDIQETRFFLMQIRQRM